MTGRDTRTILCVDPAGEIASIFEGPGFEVASGETRQEAIAHLNARPVDCVVTEYDLSDGDPFPLLEAARERHHNVGCVLYTSVDHDAMTVPATGDTVVEYVSRSMPGSEQRLVETVERIVDQRSQVGFPLPPLETERLDTLAAYDLPGLETVAAFDRLSALVADHFDVSVAFIGLLAEESEQFISCHGADWEQLAREDSICTYAVLEEGVTVIENVQADPRFKHNETLDDLGIRSYAGANLTARDGTPIGGLCLTDGEPRSYTHDEREQLQRYADEVTEQLEFRRRLGAAHLPGVSTPEEER